jgi:glutamyl-tRNA synthetase
MILGDDGTKLSKRHGAVSVMQYHEDGFLPDAVINYLARLGWSHGDDEIFSRGQFVQWFDLDHITASSAQFNTEKLRWVNQHYIKQANDADLVADLRVRMAQRGLDIDKGPDALKVVALVKERAATLNELADEATLFYQDLDPSADLLSQQVSVENLTALHALKSRLEEVEWTREALGALVKDVAREFNLKMPRLAMPVRVLVTGEPQTPSIDATLELLGRERVLARLEEHLPHSGM